MIIHKRDEVVGWVVEVVRIEKSIFPLMPHLQLHHSVVKLHILRHKCFHFGFDYITFFYFLYLTLLTPSISLYLVLIVDRSSWLSHHMSGIKNNLIYYYQILHRASLISVWLRFKLCGKQQNNTDTIHHQ